MSACYITTVLPLPGNVNDLRWDNLDTWLNTADENTLNAGYEESGLFDDEAATHDNIRNIFTDLRHEIENEDESAAIRVHGIHLLTSGGMSHGDDPNDGYARIRRAWAFPDALEAIGFPIAETTSQE